MNVVDSSGWLEYLADGANADFFLRNHSGDGKPDDADHLPVRGVQTCPGGIGEERP